MPAPQPPIRYPFWQPATTGSETALLRGVLASNFLNEGKLTAEFEQRLAALLGCKHIVAVTSGTAALYLSLMALGIGPGDEVIVPDVTFIATANAVTMTGATPVPCDVDANTLCMCPESARQAITPHTRAIIPVHISGRSADLPALLALAKAFDLHVVEDAAEALLSRDPQGRCLGTIGTLGAFSLSPNKTITTGQGGLIATNDNAIYGRLKELKDQGRPTRGTGGADTHVSVGFNFKFTDLQAAVGLAQLDALPSRVTRQRAIYEQYADRLADVAGIRLLGFANGEAPQWTDARVHDRDALDAALLSHGMQGRRFWHALHTQAPYRQAEANFPVASAVVPQSFWLPSAFQLDDAAIDGICDVIRAVTTKWRAAA